MMVERRLAPTGYLPVLVDWDPGWTSPLLIIIAETKTSTNSTVLTIRLCAKNDLIDPVVGQDY